MLLADVATLDRWVSLLLKHFHFSLFPMPPNLWAFLIGYERIYQVHPATLIQAFEFGKFVRQLNKYDFHKVKMPMMEWFGERVHFRRPSFVFPYLFLSL